MRCREGLGVRPGVGREEGPEEREGPHLPFPVQFLEDFAGTLGGGVSISTWRFWGSGAAHADYESPS